MTAGHKSTVAATSFIFTTDSYKHERFCRATAERGLHATNGEPESPLAPILAPPDETSATKTWNLCSPAHDPPFFSISCTSHSPAYGYGRGQTAPRAEYPSSAKAKLWVLGYNQVQIDEWKYRVLDCHLRPVECLTHRFPRDAVKHQNHNQKHIRGGKFCLLDFCFYVIDDFLSELFSMIFYEKLVLIVIGFVLVLFFLHITMYYVWCDQRITSSRSRIMSYYLSFHH